MRCDELFAPLGPSYDRWASRALVRPGPALAPLPRLARSTRARPTRCSTSRPAPPPSRSSSCGRRTASSSASTRAPEMLEEGRRRVALAARDRKIRLVGRRAPSRCRSRTGSSTRSRSPTCCATSTTRPATLRELARVVKPGRHDRRARVRRAARRSGGRSGSSGRASACRRPAALIGDGWHEVGSFLGPSIREHYEQWPLAAPARGLARRPGIEDVQARRLSLGGGVVTWGRKKSVRPAFYALRRGGWRDYVTLLHLPYTAWHLSYVAVGAALAPRFHLDRLLLGARGVLPRDGRRGARARRAERTAAAHADPGPGARRARASSSLAGALRDRRRRGDRVGLRPARVRRRRRRSRAGLQPRGSAALPQRLAASRSRGARFPALTGYFVEAQTLRLEAIARRRATRPR